MDARIERIVGYDFCDHPMPSMPHLLTATSQYVSARRPVDGSLIHKRDGRSALGGEPDCAFGLGLEVVELLHGCVRDDETDARPRRRKLPPVATEKETREERQGHESGEALRIRLIVFAHARLHPLAAPHARTNRNLERAKQPPHFLDPRCDPSGRLFIPDPSPALLPRSSPSSPPSSPLPPSPPSQYELDLHAEQAAPSAFDEALEVEHAHAGSRQRRSLHVILGLPARWWRR